MEVSYCTFLPLVAELVAPAVLIQYTTKIAMKSNL